MTNYTEQLMYGLKPIHRDEARAGQSKWYYLDPRYDDDDERHQIDVENENTPNPYANQIQNYLIITTRTAIKVFMAILRRKRKTTYNK